MKFLEWLWNGRPFQKTITLENVKIRDCFEAIKTYAIERKWTEARKKNKYTDKLDVIATHAIFRTNVMAGRSTIDIELFYKGNMLNVGIGSKPWRGTAEGDPDLHHRNVEQLANYLILLFHRQQQN